MAKAMDLETAKRIVSEHYDTVILINEPLSDCKVIHKGESLRNLSNLRLYMGIAAGVNMSIQQVYEPEFTDQPYERKITMLHGSRDVVYHTKNKPKVIDPNKWQCNCGEENDKLGSKRKVRKNKLVIRCETCLQWSDVEEVAG